MDSRTLWSIADFLRSVGDTLDEIRWETWRREGWHKLIEVKVTPAAGGDTFTIETTSQDVYRWEKSGRGRSLARLSEGLSMEAMYQLSHLACRRLGLHTGTLDEFIDNYVIDMALDDSAVGEALLQELTEWRDIAANVETDALLSQLDDRISELQREAGASDPTPVGA